MKTGGFWIIVLGGAANWLGAQIPVTDVVNLAANQAAQAQNIAKWVENIEQLHTQVTQLNQQISIAADIRNWAGDPAAAGGRLKLDLLDADTLTKSYRSEPGFIEASVGSFDSLGNTSSGRFRSLSIPDINGDNLARDPLLYRRYAVLDAKHDEAVQVGEKTKARVDDLQREIAATLAALKAAGTDAETQKLGMKLSALGGQLLQVETERRRAVDETQMEKAVDDARAEQERVAAAEAEAHDAYLANLRVTAFMKTISLAGNSSATAVR